MTRLRAILAALQLAAPHFPERPQAAQLLLQLEHRWDVRAELIIADAEHESRWQPDAINRTSGATGLMQVMPASAERQLELLDWRTNLRVGAADFALARQYCQRRFHTGLARQWLWLPTGNDAVQHSHCGFAHGRRLATPAGIVWLLRRTAELRARAASVGR